jgi:hypothetical protein
MMTRECAIAMSPAWLCLARDTTPTFFPGLNSSPLRGISASTFTIVDRDLLLPKTMLFPTWSLSLFSCLGHKFPLSSDFSHLFRCLDQPRLTRDCQTSPITSSQIFRSPPIYPHGSCLVLARLTHLASPRLTSLSAPPVPCSPHSHVPPCASCQLTDTHTAYHHRCLLVTRFIRFTDTPDRLSLSLPTQSSDAHVIPTSLRPIPSSHLIPIPSSRPHR